MSIFTPLPRRRCYVDLDSCTACPNPARYYAVLRSSTMPMYLLCLDHAAKARADDDVESIASLPRETAAW